MEKRYAVTCLRDGMADCQGRGYTLAEAERMKREFDHDAEWGGNCGPHEVVEMEGAKQPT